MGKHVEESHKDPTILEALNENNNIDARLQIVINLVFCYKILFKEVLLLIVFALNYCCFLSSVSFKLHTKHWVPIPSQKVGLLLGCTSLSLKAIIFHTGVIDED